MSRRWSFRRTAKAISCFPFKTVDELLKTLEDEGKVKIQATENQIAFEFGEMLVVSKLIEGTYPNFRQVIPGPVRRARDGGTRSLVDCSQPRFPVASEKSNSVKLVFGKNKLEITATLRGSAKRVKRWP